MDDRSSRPRHGRMVWDHSRCGSTERGIERSECVAMPISGIQRRLERSCALHFLRRSAGNLRHLGRVKAGSRVPRRPSIAPIHGGSGGVKLRIRSPCYHYAADGPFCKGPRTPPDKISGDVAARPRGDRRPAPPGATRARKPDAIVRIRSPIDTTTLRLRRGKTPRSGDFADPRRSRVRMIWGDEWDLTPPPTLLEYLALIHKVSSDSSHASHQN